MKINMLRINGFGKVKDTEIELKEGINIIKGQNEAGKSTIVKFIPSILYGVSKNKNGKEISDFEKYYPWTGEEYSGKIEYELENGEKYEVFRDFKKKNPMIYNHIKEEISRKFPVDKNRGIEFFLGQTGIDEETFFNTAISQQEAVKLEKNSQNSVIQKMSNVISSGNDNISYKKTLEKINKKQNEDIGTQRTSQRPINTVENKIRNLIDKREKLEIYKVKNNNNFNILEESKFMLELENRKIELLQELKSRLENNRVKNAEINFSKNLEEDYYKKIASLENMMKNQEIKNNSKFIFKYIVFILALIILLTVLMAFGPHKKYCLILIIPISFIFLKMINDIKNNKKIDKNKTKTEIEILISNLENQKSETRKKQNKLLEEIEKENISLIKKYMDDIDAKLIEAYLLKNYDEIQKEINLVDKNINSLRFKINTLEREALEINNQLNDLAKVEEELNNSENEKKELESLDHSYNIAKECLEKAYIRVKQNISPQFKNNLCQTISQITENKYTKIDVNDNEGLEVEIENGSHIPVSRLSVGTIDQMYLSLRLSILREVSNETIPIILDEAFAYFDDERLENILQYMNHQFKQYQIIIFTCSDREAKCLNNMNIEYHLINLEK